MLTLVVLAGVKLVEQLCRLDIEPNDDEVDRIARDQASKYIEDVRRRFKDDERAKKCKRDPDGYPVFTPVGETCTACRS